MGTDQEKESQTCCTDLGRDGSQPQKLMTWTYKRFWLTRETKTQKGLQGSLFPTSNIPTFPTAKPAQSTRRGRHLQRKLHPSSRHVPNEVIDVKDDELVFRHLKASLQEKNPTSTVCPTRQTSSMGWETLKSPQASGKLQHYLLHVSEYQLQISSDSSDHASTQAGWLLISYTCFLKYPIQQLTSSSTNFPVHPLPFSSHKAWLSPHSIIPLPCSVRWWDQTSPLKQKSESPPESLLPHSAGSPDNPSNPNLTLLQISAAPLQGRLPLSKPGLPPFTVSEPGGFGSWALFQLEHTLAKVRGYLNQPLLWRGCFQQLLWCPKTTEEGREELPERSTLALKSVDTVGSQSGKCLSRMKYSWFLHPRAHEQHTNAGSCGTIPAVQSQACPMCPVTRALALLSALPPQCNWEMGNTCYWGHLKHPFSIPQIHSCKTHTIFLTTEGAHDLYEKSFSSLERCSLLNPLVPQGHWQSILRQVTASWTDSGRGAALLYVPTRRQIPAPRAAEHNSLW